MTSGAPDASESTPQSNIPIISLPKGGGAIRGLGEKFTANPVTGTGSMSVPIATSPGRSGFGPQLSLSYDSGAGNGPFGFGWSLSLPQISRKTDKGLPQYLDGGEDQPDSDVFLLSGAEDLVPMLAQDAQGRWAIQEDTSPDGNYRIRRYRPRIEGLFARIERWTRIRPPVPGEPEGVHWRSLSRDNILTLYGLDAQSRIADPLDASRIFTWLICETRDDKGNAVLYRYKAENGTGVELSQAHERNRGPRNDLRRTANRYLKRILYGNRTSLLDDAGNRPRFLEPARITDAQWMFEVVFDYDDHDQDVPKPKDDEAKDAGGDLKYPWKPRPDPFSSYRSGFEVRTYRLCRRVLMFHHFPGEPGVGADCLVRSTDFSYSDEVDSTDIRNPVYTFLRSVTQTGYKRKPNNGGYDRRSLPPVEFTYTEPIVQETVEEVDSESLENLPIGLDGSAYRWTDLHGEGIPGILTEQAGAWFYKRNLSPIPQQLDDGRQRVMAKFAPLETVALKPNLALAGGADFMDLAGDGLPDLVVLDGPTPGLYEHDEAEGWQPFRPFTSRLNRDLRDPNLKFMDLDGDGHADVLITEDNAFVWHPSLEEEGFGPERRVTQSFDEEKGPRLVFADITQSVYLADLSGDGLTDLVRIRNGEVCYWPNLGYGRFGAKVTMDHAPWFDHPDQFDPKRLRLGDIDGSGTTDLIYLHRDGVRLYFNQSGNSWSEPRILKVFPRVDDLVSIMPLDLLGNGTACLVWSSPLPGDATLPMRYVNLMGGQKPHLLVKTVNNLGAETHVHYAPSTKFYLQDKRDGKPWITRLPFPVHVVERVETWDHISRNRFVTRYAYHHGYFDGEEREFRGFGCVDQWDTEEFAALTHSSSLAPNGGEGWDEGGTNLDPASHVPPVHTKTWFHTGAYLDRERISRHFEDEYYREPGLNDAQFRNQLLPDTTLPPGLTLEEEREACRALKGMMLRQEVYALDGRDADETYPNGHPYTVLEQDFTIQRLQPLPPSPIRWERAGVRGHAVFFTHPREALTYHYERNPADPRIQHALTLEVDDFGNVLKEAAIGYGRRQPDAALPTQADRDKQALIHITFTENVVTTAITDQADQYRTPLPAESRTYELRKLEQEKSMGGATKLYRFDELLGHVEQSGDGNHDVTYEDIEFSRAQQAAVSDPDEREKYFRRLIERVRTLYRPDDLGAAQNDPLALLPLGTVESLALPGESYKLAFTPGLLDQVFIRNGQPLLPANPADVLEGGGPDRGGYVDLDGNKHWWIPSGRSFFTTTPATLTATELREARQHFFLPRRYRDPFGYDTQVTYDGPANPADPRYDLLVTQTRDAVGNTVTALHDYRVLQPRQVTDPNGNRSQATFDVLGLVVGTAVMGKASGPTEGDLLDASFIPDLTQSQIDTFFAQPRQPHPTRPESEATAIVHELLAKATTRIVYDLERFHRTRKANPNDPGKWEPPFAATIARETHVSDLPPNQKSKLQISFSYSDGFGREIQKKIQAEPAQGTFMGNVMADDPIAYYRLRESAGATTVRDSSGHANDARVSTSGITLGVPGLGYGDTAARFDGQGSGRIVIPEAPQFRPKRITIEAVISWAGSNGFQQRILEKSFSAASPTWPTYGLSVLEDGSAYVELVIAGRPGIDSVISARKVTPNTPTHLAATYDGNAINIYVNGALDASQAVVGDILDTSGPSNVGIGNQVERDRPFNGMIDEVALYDRALPPDRIRSHFEVRTVPRWVGNGWTVFNNKGKPVRQFEPFFTDTPRFEFAKQVGVSPILFYDPAERVVATLHPNHTYEKVVFDPWQQTTHDANDTVAHFDLASRTATDFDPATDPDVGSFFRRLSRDHYLPIWFDLRTDPAKANAEWPDTDARGTPLPGNAQRRDTEREAAARAAAHADTPTTAHFDALGRPFLTAARNRVVCAGHDLDGTEESIATRVEMDIEGNQREVRDERKLPINNLPAGATEQRAVMRYAYDLLGNRIRQDSMEAGSRWMLNDATGKPIRAWDSRGQNFTTQYDALRRPIEWYVRGMFSDPDPLKPNSDPRTLNPTNATGLLVEKIEYGEGVSLAGQTDQDLNLRTRIYRQLDSAGEIVNAAKKPGSTEREAYDFNGNLLRSSRRLATSYQEIPDWSLDPESQLDLDERFESSTRYDALNRPIQSVAPHSDITRAGRPNRFNILQPVFNEAGLLEQVHVWLERTSEPAGLLDPANTNDPPSPVGVSDIDYDAKGQRTLIDYRTRDATVIRTTYAYDRETFRLMHLYTRRGVDPATAQGVAFTEDCDNPNPPPDTTAAPEEPPAGKGCGLQNLHYTYDPAGNITHIRDDAQQTIYFRNKRVEPSNDYVYDALYRLIQATGREHLGQVNGASLPPSPSDAFNTFHVRLDQPGDGNAMGTYTERYVYDAVGNFLQMQHRGADPAHPGWTRRYTYGETSLLEGGKQSNRLSRTHLGHGASPAPEPYSHDAHGNMIRMPHLGGGHAGGSGSFAAGDLLDAPSLAARLKQPTRPMDQWLAAQLSPATSAGLVNYAGTGPVPAALQNGLLQDLNGILNSASPIYERDRFAGVALCSETRALLEENPGGPRLVRLNRRLLEDAYPEELSRPSATPNMHWDYQDRLRQADLGGGGAAWYMYDASGQRVRKVVVKNNGNLTEERLYLGGSEIFRKHGNRIGTNTATLERETLHIMDDQRRVALVETRTFPAAPDPNDPLRLIRYQFGNHLGSASLELDEQARIISYEEYAPYGNTTYQAVRSQTEAPKRYRYTGMERDEESGLSYHGARYFAPWLGRWESCDPIGIGDALNSYQYCHDNPFYYVDQGGNAGTKSNLTATSPGDPDPFPKSSVDYENGVPTKRVSKKTWANERKTHTENSRHLKGVQSEGGKYQEHHTLDVKAAKESNVHPRVAGEPERLMTVGSRRTGMPTGSANGNELTHHSVAANAGQDIQARTGTSPEGLVDASTGTVWKFKGTGIDQTESIPIEADPKTGLATKWGPAGKNKMPRPVVEAADTPFNPEAALKSPGLQQAVEANKIQAAKLGTAKLAGFNEYVPSEPGVTSNAVVGMLALAGVDAVYSFAVGSTRELAAQVMQKPLGQVTPREVMFMFASGWELQSDPSNPMGLSWQRSFSGKVQDLEFKAWKTLLYIGGGYLEPVMESERNRLSNLNG